MNWKRLIIKSLFVFVLIIPIVWASQDRGSHDFEDKCFVCHVGLKDPSIFTREPQILCLFCHPEQKERSHPSGIIPVKSLPENFPLYKGKLICTSCHIAHTTYDEKDVQHKTFENNPYLLRVSQTGKMFCYQCHRGEFLNIKVDSHAIAFQRAHGLSHDMSLQEVLDDNSIECLSCHDGTLASDTDVTIAGGVSWEHAKGIGISHPIGIEYNQIYMKNPILYHPPSSLDSRIRLINGKIGCQTCHAHYSKYPGLLVMENEGSRLCLQCHNL